MLRLLKITQKHRYVLTNFVSRDLKIKYRGTVAGYLWSLLEPLSLVAVYYFIFGVIAKRGEDRFPVIGDFRTSSLELFFGGDHGSSTALRSNAGLVLRVHLQRDLYSR